MAKPSISTVTIDGDTFQALTTHIGFTTSHGSVGMPQMGQIFCAIEVTVDMHDTENMPYATLQKLFNLASTVSQESIKDIKISFWQDETQQDAICTYSFQGWISNYANSSGGGANHTLQLSLQPALDSRQFINVTMGN